jgi:hypothetical protein
MRIDQDGDRLWAEHHIAFGRWASDVARSVSETFRVLARVQYDRPWADTRPPRTRH